MPSNPPVSARSRLIKLCEKALLHTRADRLCRLMTGNCGTVILIYHSVPGPEAEPWVHPKNATSPALFAQQMRFLAARRHVVPLTRLVEALENGQSLEPGSVVITLDDGYLDNYTVAAPILAELGLPATFFLPTGYVDRGIPQSIDQLHSLYRARSARFLHLSSVSPRWFDLTDQRDVDASFGKLAERLLFSDFDERNRLFEELADQLRPTVVPPRLTMGWQEVSRLCDMHSGFDIGVHTRDHLYLPARNAERIATELMQCMSDIRTRVGLDAHFFSFPYGRSCGSSRRLVATHFRAAVVTDPPALVRNGADLLALPRVSPPADPELFQLYTSGVQPNIVRHLLRHA